MWDDVDCVRVLGWREFGPQTCVQAGSSRADPSAVKTTYSQSLPWESCAPGMYLEDVEESAEYSRGLNQLSTHGNRLNT